MDEDRRQFQIKEQAKKNRAFLDPEALFERDKADRERDERRCSKYADFFLRIQSDLNKKKEPDIKVVKRALELAFLNLDFEFTTKVYTEEVCTVCYEGKPVKTNCGCSVACIDCLSKHCATRVRNNEVLPWVPCPGEHCRAPLKPTILYTLPDLTDQLFAQFANEYLMKMLARSPAWVACTNVDANCKGGFFFPGDPDTTRPKEDTCTICGKKQTVTKKVSKDEGIAELLDSGLLRKCPKCAFPQMKDRGLCNVMNCGKCKIWWNWRTREMGQSRDELKRTARANGSLWEPGELDYQRRLEKTDIEAFKKLLKMNGMEYDPNYRRGRS